MAYINWASVKQYLDITGATEDALGAALCTRAQAEIERWCRRRFESTTATRYFDVPADDTLWLDDDLLSITTLTNGDATAIATTQYVLLPTNILPKYAIRLRATASVSWEGNTTYGDEQAITVVGLWGYSTTPPADIVHATIRLAAWLYRQRDGAFGQTARPEIGVIETPLAMPTDIERLLKPYKRWRVGRVGVGG